MNYVAQLPASEVAGPRVEVWTEVRADGTVWVATRPDPYASWGPQVQAEARP